MAEIDIVHLKAWVGRKQSVVDTLSLFPARALAATLDHAMPPDIGDPLPLLWHWLYFLETPTGARTGIDGHPEKGEFLPPVPLPRRMWVAGSVSIVRALRLGLPAEKVSTVRSVELKSGRSGALVFVDIEHELRQDGVTCVREEQTLVYRPTLTEQVRLPRGEPATDVANWRRTIEPDPVLLFRFSALTFNSHRIHYDRDYATREELYPGLVVHAPLLATLLLDLVYRQKPRAIVAQFKFRALRPTFDSHRVDLCGKCDGSHVALWTADGSNCVAFRASAVLRAAS